MKYVLLDTDFISKAHLSAGRGNDRLIDLAMRFTDCEFYCHEKTVEELSRHGIKGSPDWLAERIKEGDIKCFSDEDIIRQLGKVYQKGALSVYCDFLKLSCDAFGAKYYEEHFSALEGLNSHVSTEDFLMELKKCESEIGQGESLGEKKSGVLIQMLQAFYPGEVYIFCSDDRAARNNLVSIGNVKCISIMSLFYELKCIGYSRDDLSPYFDSYMQFCDVNGQETYGIWEAGPVPRRTKVPFAQVLDDIYDEKLEALGTGDLKYI